MTLDLINSNQRESTWRWWCEDEIQELGPGRRARYARRSSFGLGLVACGDDDDGDGGGGYDRRRRGGKVALLLPESKTTRYEAHDHPEFEPSLKRPARTAS